MLEVKVLSDANNVEISLKIFVRNNLGLLGFAFKVNTPRVIESDCAISHVGINTRAVVLV